MKNYALLAYSVIITLLLLFVLSTDKSKPKEFPFRDDYRVIFEKSVIDELNVNYKSNGPEDLYCLMGRIEGSNIYVDSLQSEKLVFQSAQTVVYENDPPCQIEGSVGSLHTHPSSSGCNPSSDDYFTFGEMKAPEPIVNAVQCAANKFYIFKMPLKQEAFDFRILRWETVG